MADETYVGAHRRPDDAEPTAPPAPFQENPEPEPEGDTEAPAGAPEPVPEPASPIRPADHRLRRWTFVLVLIAVWIPADLIGLALFYDWYHSINKTPAVLLVLLLLVVCTVAGLLLAMVQHKPLVAALSVAAMSAPFASAASAAALYGAYAFHWIAS